MSGQRDFDVVLTAFASGQVAQRRSVHVVREERLYTIGGVPQCQGDLLTVSANAAENSLLDRMKVIGTAAGADGRPVTVQHFGQTVIFPPGTPDAFMGAPVTGPWILSVPATINECSPPPSDPRWREPMSVILPALSVTVRATCGGMAPEPRPTRMVTTGTEGQPCYRDGSCYGTLQCRLFESICIDPNNPPPVGSSPRCNGEGGTAQTQTFVIGLEDQYGCGAVVSVRADSSAEAAACARNASPIPAGVVDGELQYYAFCKMSPAFGNDMVYLAAFSEERARQCGETIFQGSTLVAGLCPRQ